MTRTILVTTLLVCAPTLARADSASEPLLVTATVVSTCTIESPQSAEASRVATFPVTVTCGTGTEAPRVQRPVMALRRRDERDAVLTINF
jgi:hypothetical protein